MIMISQVIVMVMVIITVMIMITIMPINAHVILLKSNFIPDYHVTYRHYTLYFRHAKTYVIKLSSITVSLFWIAFVY